MNNRRSEGWPWVCQSGGEFPGFNWAREKGSFGTKLC